MKFKIAILVIVTIVPGAFTHAQTLVDTLNFKIPVEYLKEDLTTLKKTLQASQPGLYLYISKDSLEKAFEKINSSFTEPLTPLEFFQRIAPLNGILRNLHTRIWPSVDYEKATETILPRFPIDIYWHEGTMYVLRNHTNDSTIEEGSIIKSINGESSKSIFEKILACRVRDGYNESYPIAQAAKNFSYYYAQLTGTPENFHLELTARNGVDKTVHIKSVTGPQLRASRINKYKGKYHEFSEDYDAWIANREPALRFEIKSNFAVLTVRTFYQPAIDDGGQDYEKFFSEAFKELYKKDIQNLIIDLRNNHGGTDPVAMSLLSHLHDSPLHYYKRRTTFVKPDAKHVRNGDVYEIIGRGPWTGKVRPAKNIHKGSVYVIMNGYCVSAAGEFIGHLKNLNRAVFIGEEAGGNPVIFTGGVSIPVDLPHTHITGTIPLQLVEMNVTLQNTGHGVIPDHQVKPTIEDVLKGKDVEMEFVLELVKKQR